MTAVEWILYKINDAYLYQYYTKEIEQAKEMEKQQIMDARLTAPSELTTYSKTTYLDEAEKYYKEKFNKQ